MGKSYQLVGFNQPLECREIAEPRPTGREVVLRVLGSGVCHSDVHICEGFHDLGGGKKISLDGKLPLPLTPGHEIAGEVVSVGDQVTSVVVGDKVLAFSWIGCGDCDFCQAEQEQLCRSSRFLGLNRAGGYADYVTVPHDRYLISLDGLDVRRASPLACSGLTTYSALKKLGADVNLRKHPIVIIGAGGLGLMALQLNRMMGGVGAIVADIDATKRQVALDKGAWAAFDSNEAGVGKAIRKAAGGEIRGVIDFVGAGQTSQFGFDMLGVTGKLMVVGLFGGAMTISVPLLPIKSAKIEGSYIGSLSDLKELVALVRNEGMPDIPIDFRPLSDVNAALSDLQQGRVTGRVILTP